MSTLSKNNDWTELDEQFKNLMQRMMEESSDFYDEPQKQVDYSFLDNKTPIDNEQYHGVKGNMNKGMVRKSFHTFASRIAVIVFGILIAGSGIAIWINSQPANALKFHMEKNFYEVKDGVFSTDEEEQNAGALDQTCITRKYKSMEDIDKAKEFMPNLPVPEYIPQGYILENLQIDKAINDVGSAFYTFKSGNKSFYINIIQSEQESSYEMDGKGSIVEVDGKQVCIWEDQSTDSYGCNYIFNNMTISVTGQISKEEMLEIIKEIR